MPASTASLPKLLWGVVVAGLSLLAPAPVPAQTVQLPQFGQFSVNTSVLVPDRGAAYLGGVGRSASGRSTYGLPGAHGLPMLGRPFGGSAIGGTTSGGGMSVSAYIHDFQAMDEAILAEAAARHGGAPWKLDAQHASRSAYLDRVAAEQTAPREAEPQRTVADVLRDRELERAKEQLADQQQWADFLARGQAAEAAGKTSLARTYYRMVANNAHGDLKTTGESRLAALRQPSQNVVARER